MEYTTIMYHHFGDTPWTQSMVMWCILLLITPIIAMPQCNQVGWLDREKYGAHTCAPIPLLYPDSQTHTKILADEAGLAYLRCIKTPIVVISVVGRARSGKSLSLNTILGVRPDHGFAVGHTEKAVTFGAYIWPAPLTSNIPSVLVVDTEGLGLGPSAYDKALLMLALVASDMLIYHMSDYINMDDVARLYGMACLIDDYAHRGIIDTGLVQLPHIAWVVQRYILNVSRDHTDTPQQRDLSVVFDELMAERTNLNNDPAIAQFNYTVSVVKRMFPSHSAYLVPPATHGNMEAWQLTSIPPSDMSPAYQDAMARLASEMSQVPPRVQGRTGVDVAAIIEVVVPAANNHIDVLGDRVVDAILRERALRAVRSISEFVNSMQLPMEPDDVMNAILMHAHVHESGLLAGAAGAAPSATDSVKMVFETARDVEIERAKIANIAASDRVCAAARRDAEMFIRDEVAYTPGVMDANRYAIVADGARRMYKNNAVGPARVQHEVMLESVITRRGATVEASEVPRVRVIWLVVCTLLCVACHIAATHTARLGTEIGVASGLSAAFFLVELFCLSIIGLIIATVFTTPPYTFEQFVECVRMWTQSGITGWCALGSICIVVCCGVVMCICSDGGGIIGT